MKRPRRHKHHRPHPAAAPVVPAPLEAPTLARLLIEIERTAEARVSNTAALDDRFALLFDATPAADTKTVLTAWKAVDSLAMGRWAEAVRRAKTVPETA